MSSSDTDHDVTVASVQVTPDPVQLAASVGG